MNLVCDEKFLNKLKAYSIMKHQKMSKVIRFATLLYIEMSLPDNKDFEF